MRSLSYLYLLLLALSQFARAEHYLVELTGKSPAEMAISQSPVPNERLRIARTLRPQVRPAQERVRAGLGLDPSRVLHRLDFLINGLVVDLSAEEARQIATRPGVRAVYHLGLSQAILDQALSIIHAPEAWAMMPPGSAQGAGIKIGIIDTTLDVTHPAFQDPDLPMPDGFPKGNDENDLANTSNKIIAYRTYDVVSNFSGSGAYHGTAVAMAAAGALTLSPRGPISGVAPKAWIGFYQIGDFHNNGVLHAIDDAAADGMDVLNLSVAFTAFAYGDDRKPYEMAVERAAALGVAIVWGAANSGPDRNTILSQSLSPSNLIVGGTLNSRWVGGRLTVEGLGTIAMSEPRDGVSDTMVPITGKIRDLREVDPFTGGCAPLPGGSLQNRIALVDATTPCDGATRVTNLMNAGAAGAVVVEGTIFGTPDAPLPDFPLAFTLVDRDSGLLLNNPNKSASASLAVIHATQSADPNLLAPFSSRGPTPDYQIRPDLVGPAQYIYTAVPASYGAWGTLSGTSISTPMVAGAVALVKAVRPLATVDQLYSLVTNTADALDAPVVEAGAGRLNLVRALSATLAAMPRTMSFGISSTTGTAFLDQSKTISITNLGTATDHLQISILAADGQPKPYLSVVAIAVDPGGSVNIPVRFAPGQLKGGEYQGFVRIAGTDSGTELRIPYWFAVPTGVPANLVVRNLLTKFQASATYRFSPYIPEFLVLDSSGIPITSVFPTLTVVSGAVSVTTIDHGLFRPQGFQAGLAFGSYPGLIVMRARAGSLTQEFTLQSFKPVDPRIEPTTLDFNFGQVLVGASKDLDLRLASTGGAPLVISKAPISDPRFRLISPVLPFTAPPGSTVHLVVRYSPTAAVASSGTMSIVTNDPVVSIWPYSLSGTGATTANPLTLQVDGNIRDLSIGYPNGAQIAYFVNRLTPPKYPAVLQSVQIYFPDWGGALPLNTPITVIARPNPSGTADLASYLFQQLPATVGKLDAFNTYTFAPGQTLRIESGDFVVGFQANNPPNVFPVSIDTSTASQKRSYLSYDGIFRLVDIDAGIPGNFLIRAVVTFP